MTACNLQFVVCHAAYIVQSCRYRGPSTPRPPDPQKKRVGNSLRALHSEAVTKFGFQSAAGKLGFVAGGG